MAGGLLTVAGLVVFALVGLGIWAEVRRKTVGAVLRGAGLHPGDAAQGLSYAARHHPNPGLAVFESLFWLALCVPLLDHLLDPDNGTAAWWVWALTIGPHEIGHVICIPFGRFLMVAGGSFWQVAIWVIVGAAALWGQRRINIGLLGFMLAGHSFINMSVYIRDAQERDLPLLFGLGEDAHDWYNLLRWLGILEYDDLVADVALTFGGLLAGAVILCALVSVWILPRRRATPRYEGEFFSALGGGVRRAALAAEQGDITYYSDPIRDEIIDAYFDLDDLDKR
ncbi:MAG: hypothetical protein ACLFTK_17125 [Anaerolineales bacterium]